MHLPSLTPESLQFVLLSFEGPDEYSTAGGLGVRMKELGLELSRLGFRTHHVFVGDPELPARSEPHENLVLHRWAQWLSRHHPHGVYDGEEAKLVDWDATVPPFVVNELVAPAAARGMLTAVLAEEWHTANSACLLSDQLWVAGLRQTSVLVWTANNVMGFDRIDWPRLDFCSQIATVSRYMKHLMWAHGVNPVVIPNGIPESRIKEHPPELRRSLRAAVGCRELLFKIGRWSPDKRWNMAVAALDEERLRAGDATMVIRGGIEPHAVEVLQNARNMGLKIVDVRLPRDLKEAVNAVAALPRAHIYNVLNFMSDDLISLLYHSADGVLANSGHEPFGLVGLEVMAAGGVAFVGSTGEDYAIPFLNAIVLDSDDPGEINIALHYLRTHPDSSRRIRDEAVATARRYTWRSVIEDVLLSKLSYMALKQEAASGTADGRTGATGPAVSPRDDAAGDSETRAPEGDAARSGSGSGTTGRVAGRPQG
jgi:glycosyltransferase involved in cell wall biosynthesis